MSNWAIRKRSAFNDPKERKRACENVFPSTSQWKTELEIEFLANCNIPFASSSDGSGTCF